MLVNVGKISSKQIFSKTVGKGSSGQVFVGALVTSFLTASMSMYNQIQFALRSLSHLFKLMRAYSVAVERSFLKKHNSVYVC